MALFAGAANAQTCPAYTYSFASGTTAVASQVNSNFASILNCANNNLVATSGGTLTNGVLSGTTTVASSNTSIKGSSASSWLGINGDPAGFGTGPSMIMRGHSSTGDIDFYSGSSRNVQFRSGGNVYVANSVGIGTASPSYPLHVNGTAYATGAAGALSDRRHKTAIAPLDADALDIVARLKPVTFAWVEPKDDGMRGRQIGFIAQDVATVIPEVILTMNHADMTLGLKYDALIPVLTKALQQQQAQISELSAEVRTLQAANDGLRQKVDDIGNIGGGENVRRAAQ